jgi:hypothetical protein
VNPPQILHSFARDIASLLSIMEGSEMDGMRLYSSSLLLVFDADGDRPHPRLKLIDLVHSLLPSEDSPGPDAGFIMGVQTLLRVLAKKKNS